MAEHYGIKKYPSPAGGCLLTDKGYSQRLRDLLYVQNCDDPTQLHLLKPRPSLPFGTVHLNLWWAGTEVKTNGS